MCKITNYNHRNLLFYYYTYYSALMRNQAIILPHPVSRLSFSLFRTRINYPHRTDPLLPPRYGATHTAQFRAKYGLEFSHNFCASLSLPPLSEIRCSSYASVTL